MPTKKTSKKIEVPAKVLSNKALEFILVTFPKIMKQKEYKAFIHYSTIMFIDNEVYAGPHSQKIKETPKQITEAIIKIGII